jgi:hypothetical protein
VLGRAGGGGAEGGPAPNPFGLFLQAVKEEGAKGLDAGVGGGGKAVGKAKARQRGLSSKELDIDVEDVVRSLYDKQPFICKTDARRFRTQKALDQHLDALFRANRAKKEGEPGRKERLWFRTQEDWLQCWDTVPASKPPDRPSHLDVKSGASNRQRSKYICSITERERARERARARERESERERDHHTSRSHSAATTGKDLFTYTHTHLYACTSKNFQKGL